ncbi:23S rRNA (pseudouridine(1915)-N(3))-methyltransferase RlmH [Rubrobacter marinus]|uniref:Ribosomal RNA large subunit methyltransferase H n=1 Tax=Rubrobacter marinus TaxID=2653852 RepID=A0A6G8PWY2_9ACTN|nr:23S rRNA (pseudouridine(1915)-N(3))-methyltransferase RlmH [Rubrobacter marinus]QIN78695.1 23S rRNA (pseudouridine(1915)-N(3))-methyltransferase RlmH [Rubrobacter marinus]
MIRRATVLAVGRLKGWAADGSDDYLKRLRRYFPIEVVEVPEEDLNRRAPAEVLSAEATRLLRRLPEGAHLVVLDRERGRRFSSEDLARHLDDLGLSGNSHVAFVLGGPLGLAPEVLQRADTRLSFGDITLPHALARVVLLEQLYRAAKISRGEKYHY